MVAVRLRDGPPGAASSDGATGTSRMADGQDPAHGVQPPESHGMARDNLDLREEWDAGTSQQRDAATGDRLSPGRDRSSSPGPGDPSPGADGNSRRRVRGIARSV